MKRQKPQIGDIFIVPLPDGSGSVGQIVGREPKMLNSWTCAFSQRRVPSAVDSSSEISLTSAELISVQFVTGDLLKKGIWSICSSGDVLVERKDFPYEETRDSDWVGATMRGSGIMTGFLSAFHGLTFWDEMKDPTYYEQLLLPRVPPSPQIKRKT